MQNIDTILNSIDINDELKNHIKSKVVENYKTVAEFEKIKSKLDLTSQDLSNSNKTLDSLNDELKNATHNNSKFEEIQKEYENYKTQIIEIEKQREQDAQNMDLENRINAILTKNNIVDNPYIKNGLISDIKNKYQENSTLGLSEIFNELTLNHEGLFKNKNESVNISPAKISNFAGEKDFKSLTIQERLQLYKDNNTAYHELKGD